VLPIVSSTSPMVDLAPGSQDPGAFFSPLQSCLPVAHWLAIPLPQLPGWRSSGGAAGSTRLRPTTVLKDRCATAPRPPKSPIQSPVEGSSPTGAPPKRSESVAALAALATAGFAAAQSSSVTLFGVVDATVQRVSNKGTGAGSVTRLTNSGYNSSRLGFRGTEDLGGGMSASFWLEAGVSNDDGQGAGTSSNNQAVGAFNATTGANAPVRPGTQGLTFNRRSTVSLAGGWGELRLGRDYTPQFWNLTVFDPFGTNGAGTTQTLLGTTGSAITGATTVRASNSIGYFLPGNLGGFYGQVQHYRGENPSTAGTTEDDGNGFGARIGYAAGPLNIALGLSRTDASTGDIDQNNIGAQWDFGVAKLMGHIAFDEVGTAEGRGWLIGGLVPMGTGEIRASFSQYCVDNGTAEPRSRKMALGYVHNLSKRTAVYTTYARVRNSNGATSSAVPGAAPGPAANASSSAFDFGVRHSF